MTPTFLDFLSETALNPVLLITVILTLGVIFVNGWTDAPNAIATCVSTRAMGPRAAIMMAAVFNFLGVLVMTLINATVAETIYNMVDFGGDPHEALIAGLSGAAIALQGGMGGINGAEWVKVLYGLALSTVLGFSFGWIAAKLTVFTCRGFDRRKTTRFFRGAQIGGGAAMAFMHGAQDGQKFMGVFLLGMFLTRGQANVTEFTIPLWLMVLCSAVMAIGTSIGGYRIIKAVGMDMVKLETYQGFSADLAAACCLLLSSLTGVPVSTTHTKTTAIMGVGAAKRLSSVNWGVVKEMVLTWVLTFPGCGLIGLLVARLFLWLF